MSKAAKTRAFIIEQTAPVFNKKGYAGTSLQDLIDVTGLTKGAIYGNFENKDEVAAAVFQYNSSTQGRRMQDAMDGKAGAAEKLMAFTAYFRNNWKQLAERGGCPLQNASVEADDNLDFLKKHVQQGFKNWAQLLARVIEEGQASREFHKKFVARDYAYLFIMILEGGILLAKLMNGATHLEAAISRIEQIIKEELTT